MKPASPIVFLVDDDLAVREGLSMSIARDEVVEAMRRLVYAFYDHEFSFRRFLTKYPNLRGDVTDTLIGNLLKDFEPLNKGMAEFARIPDPLPHGRPFVEAR